MDQHCKNIVIPLFQMTKKGESDSNQFSITLPTDAIEMIEQGLIPFGLYGKKRATICSALILDMLKQPAVQDHIRQGREKKRRPVS